MTEFIEQIKKNLTNNGFPMKKVSLPLEKMYEVADEKGLNFNAVLDELKNNHGINHTKEVEKIIFYPELPEGQGDWMTKAQEMMSKMDPEQLRKIQEQIMNMSPEEKEKMMEQARKMGMKQ